MCCLHRTGQMASYWIGIGLFMFWKFSYVRLFVSLEFANIMPQDQSRWSTSSIPTDPRDHRFAAEGKGRGWWLDLACESQHKICMCCHRFFTMCGFDTQSLCEGEMIHFWSISFTTWSIRAWSKGEHRLVVVQTGVALPVLMTCWTGNETVVGFSDDLISSGYWAKTFCTLFNRTSLLNVTCALLIWWSRLLVNRGIGLACGNVRWRVSKSSWALLWMNQSHPSVSGNNWWGST